MSTKTIHFSGAAYCNNYLWFSALEWNGCYRANMETGESEFLGFFDYAGMMDDKMFMQVLEYEKNIYFIPWFSDYLVRVNTENLEKKYWRLPEEIIPKIAKFRAANMYNGKIYMFPHVGGGIYIFDISTEQFECDKDWIEAYDEFVDGKYNNMFLQGERCDSDIYLPTLSGNFMMKYNLDNRKSEMISIAENEKYIVDITKRNADQLLLLTQIGNIYTYKLKDGKLDILYEYTRKKAYPYKHVIVLGNSIYLIPAKEDKIIKLEQGVIKELEYPSDWKLEFINVGITSVFWGYLRQKDRVLIYPCMGNKAIWLETDLDTVGGTVFGETSQKREAQICDKWFGEGIMNEAVVESKMNINMVLEKIVGTDGSVVGKKEIVLNGYHIWKEVRDK